MSASAVGSPVFPIVLTKWARGYYAVRGQSSKLTIILLFLSC